MHIGIDARMFGEKETGIGVYTKNLIENLLKIDKENQYIVFTLKDRQEELPNAKNLKKISVSSHWYTYSEQTKLLLEFLREKVDFMHFTHFNAPVFYNKPFISTIHDITPLFFPGHKMNSFIRRSAFKLTFNHSVKKSAHIITVSDFTKQQAAKYFAVNPNKITTINLGIMHSFKKEISYDRIKAIKEKFGITKPYLFFIGVWRNHKNVARLVEAFGILRDKYKLDIQLVLGGKEDPYYPEVRKTWERLNLEKHIITPGFIEKDDLPVFYKGASALIRPSFIEGFVLVELEAMSVGTPVVASNASCIPELLGDSAAYFNPLDAENMAEAIYKVISDENLKNSLVQKGFKQIEKFNWGKTAQETLNIYKNTHNAIKSGQKQYIKANV
ncbi:MAG: glycosyltransferase family 1 protein [bacterium]